MQTSSKRRRVLGNFWPKFAWELSQRRRVLISSPLCESFCSRMCAFYRSAKVMSTLVFFPRKVLRLFLDQLISYTFCVLQNPVSDMQKFDKWKLGKHLEILEKIFGEHGYKFAFVPETPPSSSSIKRAYHVGGTSFYTAHGSTLTPREDVAIQQILDDMVNTDQLNIVDLNFAQDWLSQCDWAAGAFRRAGDPD
ncbi:hypothetical protein HanIR_Chr13g0669101 [Helianthus annuus]|nr:hypothetical protein HanIR_Chr13g0669101 [Helianthus annuus]